MTSDFQEEHIYSNDSQNPHYCFSYKVKIINLFHSPTSHILTSQIISNRDRTDSSIRVGSILALLDISVMFMVIGSIKQVFKKYSDIFCMCIARSHSFLDNKNSIGNCS